MSMPAVACMSVFISSGCKHMQLSFHLLLWAHRAPFWASTRLPAVQPLWRDQGKGEAETQLQLSVCLVRSGTGTSLCTPTTRSIYIYMSVDPLENSCSLLETRSPTFLWHSFFAGLGGGQRPQCGAVLSQGTEKPGGGRWWDAGRARLPGGQDPPGWHQDWYHWVSWSDHLGMECRNCTFNLCCADVELDSALNMWRDE